MKRSARQFNFSSSALTGLTAIIATSLIAFVVDGSALAATKSASPSVSARAEVSSSQDLAKKSAKDLKAELRLGLDLMKQKKYDEALVHLRKANEDPSPESLQALAILYRFKKDNLQVIRALEDLVMLKPKDFRAYRALGDAYVITDKFDKAIENYRKSFALNPKYHQAYTGLISVLDKRKNVFEIRNVLTSMYENFPGDPGVLDDLCHYYAVDSLFDKGLEYCKLALKSDPKNPNTLVYYGLLENGKYGDRKGTTRITETARKFPRSAFAQTTAAKVSAEDKLWEAASRFYRQATAIDAKDGASWLGAASAEFSAGNYGDALNYYLQACHYDHRAYGELNHSTGVLGVQKQEKWYRQYRDSQDKCSVSKGN